MDPESQMEALRCLRDVRWPLLESYALARQEGLTDPVGLVVDRSHPFAENLGQVLLLMNNLARAPRLSATTMERAVLGGLFAMAAPEIAQALRNLRDQAGRWTAVILARKGWVLTGTWQELFTLELPMEERLSRQR